ncbi:Crp/Fnr family transcriptional regulator [Chitinophaga sp.]|uniref:Crp/Fnr family transcriptional regulator n=1 Tax=Chitinophaga sp. TaxID=1869181 RepID=UPI0031D947B8
MSVDNLITYFHNYIPLNSREKEDLWSRVIEKKIKRRQFILQEHDVCRHYTFVVSGCTKMYSVDNNGAEHNIQFASENEWIMDIGSFHSERKSRLNIEAIEPSVILQIDKPALIHLYQNYPKFCMIFRVIIENKFIELQNRLLQNISSNAEERYLAFLEQYPHLSKRLPNTQVASYLGITPEFLSVVRKNIAQK